MIVKATKRTRRRQGAYLNRWLVAGAFLALSTTQIAYQDSLTAKGTAPGDRWQVGLNGGQKAAPAALRHVVVFDGVNRANKSDMLVEKKRAAFAFEADVIHQAALFSYEANLPRTAFILPEAPKNAIAEARPAKAEKAIVKSEKAPAEDAKVEQVALAYAGATDDADTASESPFAAVIAKPGTIVLDPKVKATHAWVNTPLPEIVHSKKEMKCLAEAIYFEARGEPEDGRIAVAQVVLNRVKNPTYPDTICNVVYQNKNMRNRCQFSFACDGVRDRITNAVAWKEAQDLTKRILDDERTLFIAEVGASTHYHATYVRPRWAKKMTKMDKIGRHVFYKTLKGGWS